MRNDGQRPDGARSEAGSLPAMRMDAQAASLGAESIIVMIQPDTLQVRGEQDELLVSDSVEKVVREAGGQPLDLTATCPPRQAQGWKATLRFRSDQLLIRHPAGTVFYDGTMPTDPEWRARVVATGDVLMITGPIPDVMHINPVMERGLATWTRIPLSLEK